MDTEKYDDASWHSEGEFPKDLPDDAAATHIGMFAAWAFLNGHAGALHTEDFADDLAALRQREITPGAYLLRACDGKLTSEDFDDTGNAFARAYYEPQKLYLADYDEILSRDLPTPYHVADSWQNFDRFSPRIAQRFAEWKAG